MHRGGRAGTEQEFFTRLAQAGVLVRLRHSTTNPGRVTGMRSAWRAIRPGTVA
jgi:hypothetical protein